MRCLTVADAMRAKGHDCRFLTRAGDGDRIGAILERGHEVETLPTSKEGSPHSSAGSEPPHAHWLAGRWQDDADATRAILDSGGEGILVLDHYALDARWMQRAVPGEVRRVVFDDLADREHDADLLVDQNLGRDAADYSGLVPESCRLRIGPRYALVDPRFAELRQGALERRAAGGPIRRILISMGGVDAGNASGACLAGLAASSLPDSVEVTVVMGGAALHLDAVRAQAAQMRLRVEVLVDVSDMPQRMASSDVALGGAGGTAWERCVVGLPSIVLVLARNQVAGAAALHSAGAALMIESAEDLVPLFDRQLDAATLGQIGRNAADVVDGHGISRICSELEALS